jgi:hypothetical protein
MNLGWCYWEKFDSLVMDPQYSKSLIVGRYIREESDDKIIDLIHRLSGITIDSDEIAIIRNLCAIDNASHIAYTDMTHNSWRKT